MYLLYVSSYCPTLIISFPFPTFVQLYYNVTVVFLSRTHHIIHSQTTAALNESLCKFSVPIIPSSKFSFEQIVQPAALAGRKAHFPKRISLRYGMMSSYVRDYSYADYIAFSNQQKSVFALCMNSCGVSAVIMSRQWTVKCERDIFGWPSLGKVLSVTGATEMGSQKLLCNSMSPFITTQFSMAVYCIIQFPICFNLSTKSLDYITL